VGGNGTQPPTARQGKAQPRESTSKSLTSNLVSRFGRYTCWTAESDTSQRVGKEHRLAVRTQPFLLPAIDFSTRGKPGDLGGSDTRPPLARGDGVNKRRPGVKAAYGRRLLSFKRVSSLAGSVYLFRTSETKIRQFVNPNAALSNRTGGFCNRFSRSSSRSCC
jgi:hypothetical protein